MAYANLNPISFVIFIAVLSVSWTIWKVAYRFFFHPLSSFPGPKLAIATYCYEWYYDLILGGRYTFKLRELHQRYGKSASVLQVAASDLS